MKKLIFLLLLVFTFTSCGTQFRVSTYGTTYVDPYPVQWVNTYNFDRIHWLYLNHPQFVWNNYYQHPYFIRYRRDCLNRGIYVRPYRYNRAYRTPTRNVVRNNSNIYRRNSGRSNLDYNRTRNQRYSTNRVTPQRRTYNSTRSNNTRVQRSTPSRNYSRSNSVQRRSSSVRTSPTRTSRGTTRRSSGKRNQ